MKNNKQKGDQGEKIAKIFLTKKDYEIICLNYRTRSGEIDIVARDGEYIVFVEVKQRSNYTMGYPREAVNLRKQEKIKNAALNYIAKNDIVNTCFRFDVIEIVGVNEFSVEHLENAFY